LGAKVLERALKQGGDSAAGDVDDLLLQRRGHVGVVAADLVVQLARAPDAGK